MLRKLIAEDVELLAMFEAAVTRGQGAPPGNRNAAKEERETNTDNISVCFPHTTPPPDRGHSLSYAARRLARDRPDMGRGKQTVIISRIVFLLARRPQRSKAPP